MIELKKVQGVLHTKKETWKLRTNRSVEIEKVLKQILKNKSFFKFSNQSKTKFPVATFYRKKIYETEIQLKKIVNVCKN